MKINNFMFTKFKDSPLANLFTNINEQSIYCEIQYQRDRSSFAGIVFEVKNNNAITIQESKEKILKEISKYEKLYIGCDDDYIQSIKDVFEMKKNTYGMNIRFLVYSDVRSSQIIFEELMENIDKHIAELSAL